MNKWSGRSSDLLHFVTFPSFGQWFSWQSDFGAYSSGDCFGLTPNSLLRIMFLSASFTKSSTKVQLKLVFLCYLFFGRWPCYTFLLQALDHSLAKALFVSSLRRSLLSTKLHFDPAPYVPLLSLAQDYKLKKVTIYLVHLCTNIYLFYQK